MPRVIHSDMWGYSCIYNSSPYNDPAVSAHCHWASTAWLQGGRIVMKLALKTEEGHIFSSNTSLRSLGWNNYIITHFEWTISIHYSIHTLHLTTALLPNGLWTSSFFCKVSLATADRIVKATIVQLTLFVKGKFANSAGSAQAGSEYNFKKKQKMQMGQMTTTPIFRSMKNNVFNLELYWLRHEMYLCRTS